MVERIKYMKILAVDDEKLGLEALCRCIQEASPEVELISFRRAKESLEYVKEHRIDVAFLDIQMRNMDGMELVKQMKFLQPNMNIIFSTGYSEYIYDAISEIRCSGYLLKPITTKQVIKELDNLRNPIDAKAQTQIYIQCFGNFEIFIDGKPLTFQSSKSKELLAYLVDRNGVVCNNAEIIANLWEDDGNHYSYLKKCKKNLVSTLDKVGCRDIIVSRWGGMGVDKSHFSCDYYEWLDGTPSGINAYHGQYMAQYSWAEITNAFLSKQ